jgi:hypothetical protein
MPLRPLLKNKLLLQKNYNLQESYIDMWPFWMLEENISIINDINDEEEKHRKNEEETQQKSMPNFNPSSYMNQMNGMSDKFKSPL